MDCHLSFMLASQSHPNSAGPLPCTMNRDNKSLCCSSYTTLTDKVPITPTLCAVYVHWMTLVGWSWAMGNSSFYCCCDITDTAAPVSNFMDTGTPLTWTFTMIGDALCCSRRYKACSSSYPGSAEVNWCACAPAPDIFPFLLADVWK